MSVSTETEFSLETMTDIAHLANQVSNPAPMSVQEMNVAAAKIAEEAGVIASVILAQVAQHVERRAPAGHSPKRNEAHVSLARFHSNK